MEEGSYVIILDKDLHFHPDLASTLRELLCRYLV